MISKIVIVEDEKPNADRLKRLIRNVRPDAEVVTVLDSISDCVAWFSENSQPDVVMMDVRLADGLSFEIFDQVQVLCPIIFTTAYDEYAVRAFKYNSIDYLLKPVEQEELLEAIEKMESYPQGDANKAVEGLLNFIQPKEYRSRFLLPFRDGYKSLVVSDVAYFYSELKMTRAKLHSGGEEVVPQTLEELEHQLDPKVFFRTNRQFIIHIDAIVHLHNYFNGKLKVELRGNPDVEVIVSREKAHLVKNWLDY